MKKILFAVTVLLALSMMAGCGTLVITGTTGETSPTLSTAAADTGTTPPDTTPAEETTAAETITAGAADAFIPWWSDKVGSTTADLDGDGQMDTITLDFMEDSDSYDEQKATLTVNGQSLTQLGSRVMGFCVVDLNAADALKEVLVYMDIASDDFFTVAYHYENGKLTASEQIYGMPTAVQDGVLTIENTVDMLGSWWSSTQYEMAEGFKLRQVKDAVWTVAQPGEIELSKELEVTMADGAKEILKAGTKMSIVKTDGKTFAGFKLADGREGSIAVTVPQYMPLINGVDAQEYFVMLPYAG